MALSPRDSRRLTYVGIFAVALSTLVLEILLTRITSVIAWYHLAFFVISLAMLGMTAGAVAVFLLPGFFRDELVPRRMTQMTLAFAVTTPIAAGMAMSIPLMPISDLMDFFGLLVYGGALAIPFSLGGVALTLALTRAGLPASIAYGVDLCGAAAGCALVIPLLDRFDAPSVVLFASAIAAAAAAVFSLADGARGPRRALLPASVAVLLVAMGMANRMEWDTIRVYKEARRDAPKLRPAWVKGARENPGHFCFVGWNTYSRITVEQTGKAPPFMWAASEAAPEKALTPLRQRVIRIDGAAATMMVQHGDQLAKHKYLDYDISSFAHELRKGGPAAVIGVGGGRDVITAARYGHDTVVGVELNDLIVSLHSGLMEDFSRITRIPGVELVSDEARSYMAQETRRFAVITMSLIDTWATTGAGSYSLSENGLYTAEAWEVFLDHLEDDGIYTVSRWYHPKSPGEATRMLALGMEVLFRRGVARPQDHLILLQNGPVATLLISPSAFSAADVELAERRAEALKFNVLATPRTSPPAGGGPLAEAWAITERDQLWRWGEGDKLLDYTPPTDDRPFFFNMLKPASWLKSASAVNRLDVSFLGNLQATQTLLYATLVSVLLTLGTVIGPLLLRRRDLVAADRGDLWAATAYFALIGLGFMFVEIGLLSRLNVFIGHPTVALAVLLGGIIFFTGVGSLLSDRVKIEGDPARARLYPLVPFALVLCAALASGPATHAFVGEAMGARVLVGIALVAVPALGLGLGFPLGLRLVQHRRALTGGPELGPWLWGINGACGVCASGLALGSSMVWGVPTTLAIGAACYLLLLACTRRLGRV